MIDVLFTLGEGLWYYHNGLEDMYVGKVQFSSERKFSSEGRESVECGVRY